MHISFYLEHINQLLISPALHVCCITAEFMQIRLATRWIELDRNKIRILVTPDHALNEQYYFSDKSGEAEALIIPSYSPISNRMFTRKKAIFVTCMQYFILVKIFVWYGSLKIEVRVTFTGYCHNYQVICSGNLIYFLTKIPVKHVFRIEVAG